MRTYRYAILPLFAVALTFGAATTAHAGQDGTMKQQGAMNQADAKKQVDAMKQDGLTEKELGQLQWRLNNDESLTPYEQKLIRKQVEHAGLEGHYGSDETLTPYEKKLKQERAGGNAGTSQETAEAVDDDRPEGVTAGQGGTLTGEAEKREAGSKYTEGK